MKWAVAAVALVGCGRLSFEPRTDATIGGDVNLGDAQIPVGVQFIWIGGSNVASQFGTYGTLTIPDAANAPGGRDNGAAWVAPNNHVYLLGGHAFGEYGNDGKSNDLWNHDLATGEWAWLNGSNLPGESGMFAMQGVASPSVRPGGRNDATSWSNGNLLYLFGGYGHAGSGVLGQLDDVWRWDVSLKQWAWMNGAPLENRPAAYAGADVHPGARSATFSWQTATHAYAYGGSGFGDVIGASGKLADFWRYSFGDNAWSLISGNGALGVAASYGVLGAAGSPGGRDGGCAWSDGANGAWIYGGASSAGTLGDMWHWDGATWTWIHGSQALEVAPTYGVRGVPDRGNSPGARENANCWRDTSGNLWLYGGIGQDEPLADLWIYTPEANVWTWIAGSATPSAAGVYGQRDVHAPTNAPGARSQGLTWIDPNDGSLLLFGGDYGIDASGTLGHLNDLWRIVPE